ncbi:hypothetical protein KP509_34G054100 [Ceratopteris richardii]|nr:hypothetical protein KP509_34G054100 [Ceratopteris richardii]
MNPGASCMAEKFLQRYENTPCTNSTGLDTIPGEEPNYPDYPSWLSECDITTDRVKDGRVLPDCVPAGVDSNSFASVAVQNYTQSANETISSPEYTSAGVASGKNWYVVVLATNTSSGDYFQQSGSLVSVWPAPTAITIAFAVLCTLLSGSII